MGAGGIGGQSPPSFEDRFEVFVKPRFTNPPFIRISGSTALCFSGALVGEIRKALDGETPRFWRVALDRENRAMEIRPCDKGEPGSLRANILPDAVQLTSKTLVRWLTGAGVPTNRLPAQWSAGRVRVQYGQAPAPTPAPAPKKPDAGKVIRSCGHRWKPSDHPGPTGNPLYVCEVCGYYTADPKNPILEERECKPGFWSESFEVRQDGRVYPKGWNRMTSKEAGK